MPRTARPDRALTHQKIREYILGDEQLQMTEKGSAKRLTAIEVIDRALESEDARRVRAHAPDTKRKNRL